MEAIEKTSGPCVILAGAGTGKTHTIVEKIKYLIRGGIYEPGKIVCITFSNEAANNLLRRVRKFLREGEEPKIMTFHAFSAYLLREYGEKIGLNPGFGILTPEEAKIILHRNLKVAPFYCHKYIASIGMAKDLGIGLEDLVGYVREEVDKLGEVDLGKRLESLRFKFNTLHLGNEKWKKKELAGEISEIANLVELGKFVKIWGAYEKLKGKNNYQDYSDLNNNALKLLEGNMEISEEFDYVIVDEFQDTNKVQLDFLKALAVRKNITVVGDLNQSIYRFRRTQNRKRTIANALSKK